MNSSPTIIYTFDIFETLLMRSTGSPRSAIYLVGKELPHELLKLSPQEYFKLRIAAMQQARKKLLADTEEITLTSIFVEFNQLHPCSEETRSELIRLELEAETKLLRVIPQGLNKLNEVRKHAKVCWFISDTYLPAAWLQNLLIQKGLFQDRDKLFCSSEIGLQKVSGNLFKYISKSEGQPLSKMFHYGNDLHSDVEVPVSLGMQAQQLRDGNLSKMENRWWSRKGSDDHEIYNSIIIGKSRQLRLANSSLNHEEEAVWGFYTSIVLPLHLAYVFWVFEEAKRDGVKHLYFNARDAWLSYQLFVRLKKNGFFEGVEAHYMYGSRKTWIPLLMSGDLLDEQHWYNVRMCTELKDWNATTLLGLLGLSDEAVKLQIQSDLGWSTEQMHSRLTKVYEGQFRELISSAKYRDISEQEIKKQKNIIFTYFKQIGLLDKSAKKALVDTGWSGRWHSAIADSIQNETGESVSIYFIGRRKTAFPGSNQNIKTFLFDEITGEGPKVNTYFNRFVEMCCPCPHGMTIAFEQAGGLLNPVFNDPNNNQLHLTKQLEGQLDNYVDGLIEYEGELLNAGKVLKDSVFRIIHEWWFNPPDNAHSLLEIFKFNSSPLDSYDDDYNKIFSAKELYSIARNDPKGEKSGVWMQAYLQNLSSSKRMIYKIIARINKHKS